MSQAAVIYSNEQSMSDEQKKKFALISLCLGFFMVMIDVTVVNVALPSMAESLRGGISGLQWVVDGYTLTFACFLLTAGQLADRKGSKTVFLTGLALFVLTSLGCGFAANIGVLVFFRLLKGIAAALVVPSSLALISALYETKKERSEAIGVWGGMGGIAAASGPIAGAFLSAWFGWRAVFFVNVPIGVAALVLTLKYVRNVTKPAPEHFDLLGQITAVVGVASLAYGLIEAGHLGWTSLQVLAALGISFISFLAFIFIELRAPVPMFPLKLFRSQTFSAAMSVGMLFNIAFYGQLFLLPLYFQQVRGYPVLLTGLAILPQTALSALASYLGGKLASKVGPKLPMTIGLTVGALGCLGMSFAQEQFPSYFWLMLPLAAIGFGVTFSLPAAVAAILHSAPASEAGIASGAFNASRQVGSLIGVAIFGTVLNSAPNFLSGMHSALRIGTGAFLTALALTLILIQKD